MLFIARSMSLQDVFLPVCLSVRLSVTRLYYVKRAEHIIKIFFTSGSHINLVFVQIFTPNFVAVF